MVKCVSGWGRYVSANVLRDERTLRNISGIMVTKNKLMGLYRHFIESWLIKPLQLTDDASGLHRDVDAISNSTS